MIILLIKTDQPLAELYLYKNNKQIASLLWEGHRQLATTIHLKIKELLDRGGINLSELNAIAIYNGPGSFTGLRIGHAVANALAYSLSVPVIAAEGEEGWINQSLARLSAGDNDKMVVPKYGQPARTTQPRK